MVAINFIGACMYNVCQLHYDECIYHLRGVELPFFLPGQTNHLRTAEMIAMRTLEPTWKFYECVMHYVPLSHFRSKGTASAYITYCTGSGMLVRYTHT